MERQEADEILKSLIHSWGASLIRYAFHLTRSREAAEDLAQEAFMALYADLRRGKKIDNVRAWTLAIVRKQACRLIRDRTRRGEVLEPSDALDQRSAPAAPDVEWDEVKTLFSVLTPREAEVMMLRIQVFKYREIADQLGISAKSVATLLARALRKLQRAAGRTAQERGRVAMLEEEDLGQPLQ